MSTDATNAVTVGQTETHSPTPNDYVDRGAGYLAGNLTRDPELRFTPSGRAVASLRVAETPRILNTRSQRWEDGETVFRDITVWGDQAENACECLQKGDRIVAIGRWQERSWTDKDNVVQTRIGLRADDLGPSLKFRMATPARRFTRSRAPATEGGPAGTDDQTPPPF